MFGNKKIAHYIDSNAKYSRKMSFLSEKSANLSMYWLDGVVLFSEKIIIRKWKLNWTEI